MKISLRRPYYSGEHFGELGRVIRLLGDIFVYYKINKKNDIIKKT